MSRKYLRAKLFDQGRSALQAIGLADAGYICLICGRAFTHADLQAGALSLEHVPPASLGGKAILLTCRSCNNFAGHAFEGDAKGRADFERQIRGVLGDDEGTFGHFEIEADGISVNAAVSREAGVTSIMVRGDHNKPERIDALQKVVESFTDGSTLKLKTGTGYRKKHASQADLKAAYLLCAAKFGYSFALNKRLEAVRRQLLTSHGDHFQVRYLSECDLPDGVILLCQQAGLVAAKVGANVLGLPWILGPTHNFDANFVGDHRRTLNGQPYRFPLQFEAVLDRNLHSLGMRASFANRPEPI